MSALRHRPGLDGVRALAIAAVLLYHGQVARVPGGFLGVDLFFVLSGFLITSLLLDDRARHGTVQLTQFWLRRARRLLPAAFLVILIALTVTSLWHPSELRTLRGDSLAALLYVNNWHQVFAHRSYFAAFDRPSLLQHYWSLAVEEHFYLVWPAIVFAFSRKTLMRICAGCIVVALVLRCCAYFLWNDTAGYVLTPCRMDELAMGASVLGVVMLAGTLDLSGIIQAQIYSPFKWFIIPQFIGFVVFLIAAFAETNRVPFDLPEAETELVAGFHTEYSALKFALFFMAEYVNMFTVSVMCTVLFLGGWYVPGLSHILNSGSIPYALVSHVAFIAKICTFLFFYIWVRGTLPRFRFDQLMNFGWKFLLPVALINVILTIVIVFVLNR